MPSIYIYICMYVYMYICARVSLPLWQRWQPLINSKYFELKCNCLQSLSLHCDCDSARQLFKNLLLLECRANYRPWMRSASPSIHLSVYPSIFLAVYPLHYTILYYITAQCYAMPMHFIRVAVTITHSTIHLSTYKYKTNYKNKASLRSSCYAISCHMVLISSSSRRRRSSCRCNSI